MDGWQILFYVIVGIIYLITKGVSKAKKPDVSQPTGNAGNNPVPGNLPPQKTNVPTLQDLLNEFGEASRKTKNKPQVKPFEIKKPEVKKVEQSFYEVAEEKAQQQKRKAELKAKQTAKRALEEKQRREVFTYEQSLDEEEVPLYENKANKVDYEDPTKASYEGLDDHKKRFASFEIQEKTQNVFAELLKDPQSARTAFIMGEIFKREYE